MIIDIHTHITYAEYPQFARIVREEKEPFPVRALLGEMEDDGIDVSVLLPLTNPENDAYFGVAGNIECIEAAKAYPDKLISFCNIDPRAMLNTPSADLGKMMRIYRDLGCKGIGEICANIPLSSPLYRNLFHHAERENMPMLFHFAAREGGVYGAVDDIHFPSLEKLLDDFPGARVIGHAMAFWNEIDGDLKEEDREGYPGGKIAKKGRLFDLMRNHPNLYGDISAGSGLNALSRDTETGYEFIREFNEKLFFGSDRFLPQQYGKPLPILEFMNNALGDGHISEEQYENIMSGNFKRIIMES